MRRLIVERVEHVDDRVAVGGRMQQTGNVRSVRKQPRYGVLVERLVDKEARGEAPLNAGGEGGGEGEGCGPNGMAVSRTVAKNQAQKINHFANFVKNNQVSDSFDPQFGCVFAKTNDRDSRVQLPVQFCSSSDLQTSHLNGRHKLVLRRRAKPGGDRRRRPAECQSHKGSKITNIHQHYSHNAVEKNLQRNCDSFIKPSFACGWKGENE